MDIAFTRLEAVTSRLEDLAASLTASGVNIASGQSAAAPGAPTVVPPPPPPAAIEIDELPHVAEFELIINEKMKPALGLLSGLSQGVEAMQEQVC